ncbi:MAG: restriction endonuclease [Phycisphaerae bacterium]|nr:MAG: restriction endonuclease [Phycisphaerae bacterium]
MLRPCSHPGCPNAAHYRSRCQAHARDYEQTKPYRSLYGYKWEQTSKNWRKAHPLCAICLAEGRTTLATEVDHIDPHMGCKQKFWNNKNWQSTCTPCHVAKTQKERQG